MRTRAKKKYVASDCARRENVPRHILFYIILHIANNLQKNFQDANCRRMKNVKVESCFSSEKTSELAKSRRKAAFSA